MKAKINIDIVKVSGQKVDKKMENDKRFQESTEKTITTLCQKIEKFFAQYKIKTKVTHSLR